MMRTPVEICVINSAGHQGSTGTVTENVNSLLDGIYYSEDTAAHAVFIQSTLRGPNLYRQGKQQSSPSQLVE